MSYFFHFHATTHHHPTLLYVTLHCSTLLTLHCSRLFALLYAAFNLCTALHPFVYTPECSSPQRRDVEAAGFSNGVHSEWFGAPFVLLSAPPSIAGT